MILHLNDIQEDWIKAINNIVCADAIEFLRCIPDNSVDCVLCDPPYGMKCSAFKWDKIPKLEEFWKELKRIGKERIAYVVFSTQPFTSYLVLSNIKMFRYELIWHKNKQSGFVNAKRSPLKAHENIIVFSDGIAANNQFVDYYMKYYPQGISESNRICRGKHKHSSVFSGRGQKRETYIQTHTNYPQSIININSESIPLHPTQKPVPLFSYLIKTYSNEGDLILDPYMGSWTTAIASVTEKRRFIGCDLSEDYCKIGEKRLEQLREKYSLMEFMEE